MAVLEILVQQGMYARKKRTQATQLFMWNRSSLNRFKHWDRLAEVKFQYRLYTVNNTYFLKVELLASPKIYITIGPIHDVYTEILYTYKYAGWCTTLLQIWYLHLEKIDELSFLHAKNAP